MTPDPGTYAGHASYAFNWFGYTLVSKQTNPAVAGVAIDLAVPENRDAILAALVSLIRELDLVRYEGLARERRLLSWVDDHEGDSIAFAAQCSALAMHYIDLIAQLRFSECCPDDETLRKVTDDLAKHCCSGAAQMIGSKLPAELVETWPAFAQLFEEAKGSPLWPSDR